MEIIVVSKVGHDQFPDGPVDWFPEAQAGVIGLGDCPPTIVFLEDSKKMVIVANSNEIND
jgi:hypothetical protein